MSPKWYQYILLEAFKFIVILKTIPIAIITIEYVNANIFLWKLKTVFILQMMGCLIYASLFEVFVGLTGIVGLLLRFIGPLTISVVVSLIGLSLYKIPMIYVRTHWGMSAV